MKEFLFDELVEKIRKTEGLTKKNTERLLTKLIQNENTFEIFLADLREVKEKITVCEVCFYYKIENVCPICSDESRNKKVICVVSTALDAKSIENVGKYKGVYAILNGEINITKNITPDKLKIEKLFARLEFDSELILALNATFEGEVTANFIAQEARKLKIKTTRIAKGIPMGGSLDYMDESTLENAILNRKNYEG
ncbi:recombination protein RecR [Mesoplasma syrphidae]|uniref:Recombination protein RecR n=1 Tax=Mesoplasma syrphidae TaxID=225999 RepID=A0A2K9C6J5_9MOLU|nr:recombination mediator RecR [Mesoplasma syrphidae]AUF83907.1 recombination protein RecR [Mesoplasma syrphidae]